MSAAHWRDDTQWKFEGLWVRQTCGTCGVWFAVSLGYVRTGNPIHCPAGHSDAPEAKRAISPKGGPSSIRVFALPAAPNFHVVTPGRWDRCWVYRKKKSRMTEYDPSYIPEPHNVCTYCRKVLSADEQRWLRDQMVESGVDASLFRWWDP